MKNYILLSSLIIFAWYSNAQNSFGSLGIKEYKNVHAIIVGVSDYKEIKDLTYADDDASLFYEILKLTFPNSVNNFKTLTNENASSFAIQMAIQEVTMKIKEGDLFVFYFSGHGDVGEWIGEQKGYLLGHEASQSRVYEVGGGVKLSWINEVTDAISSIKKADVWLLTDACHSGKVINEQGAESTLETLAAGFKNTTKFISCQAHEKSYEYETIQHGAFTYYLAKCFSGSGNSDANSSTLTVKEITDYMESEVRSYTTNQQTPIISASDKYMVFFKINPEIEKLINENDGQNDVASKGFYDGKKSSQLIAFEDAILRGELYGKNTAAYEQYNSIKSSVSKEEAELMKSLLIEALIKRGQENTNLFLTGRPTLEPNERMSVTAKDFELAEKLLGKEHFLYNELELKRRFFAAMTAVEEKNTKEYSSCENELLALLKLQPNAAHINQGLAILYIQKSDKQKAEEQLAAANQKVTTWAKPMNSGAYLNILEGNLDAAKKKITCSEKLEDDQDNIYLLQAYLHSANYELQNAAKALKQITTENSAISSAELLELEGDINELRGRITVAQKMYQESLKTDGDNIELLLKLGNLYKNDGDTTAALSYFKQVRSIDKDNQIAKANIAMLSNAEVVIDNNLILANDVNAVLLAVNVLEDEKRYTEAIDLLKRSIAFVDWNPDLYYELGKMQYSAGDAKSSMESVKKAIEISPYHYKSIRSLAYMYLHEKKYNEADALIKKHDPYFKESAKYLALSYQVYRQMGSKNDLYPILERAIELDSLETDAYKALYRLHIENNMYNEALREFNNLIEIGGGSKDSNDFYNHVDNQVRLMISQGIYEGQKDGLKLILDLDPYDFEMSYYMGLVLYMEKDYEGANDYIRGFNKSIQSFSPSDQRKYYHLKAKINLETGHPDLAERLFGMSASNVEPADQLGLAMAQFDQGKANWYDNFRRAGEPIDYNEDGMKRYEKMKKKAAKMGGGYGGVERNH